MLDAPREDEGLGSGEDLGHGLDRATLAVDAEERFCARGAEEKPGFGGVLSAGAGGVIEEELDAVEGLDAEHLDDRRSR